ncbi:helix-turn-helix domain-containing protein [Bacteroides sp.]
MEAEEKKAKSVHHGHNIKLARQLKGIKQEELAEKMQMPVASVSKHENTETIDDQMLNKFAKALDIPIEFLKTVEGFSNTVVFENNTITNNDHATSVGYAETLNDNKTINPLDKVVELYERLLKEKDEKYATLEKRVQNLEKLLSDK